MEIGVYRDRSDNVGHVKALYSKFCADVDLTSFKFAELEQRAIKISGKCIIRAVRQKYRTRTMGSHIADHMKMD